jgi:hypothetical protein
VYKETKFSKYDFALVSMNPCFEQRVILQLQWQLEISLITFVSLIQNPMLLHDFLAILWIVLFCKAKIQASSKASLSSWILPATVNCFSCCSTNLFRFTCLDTNILTLTSLIMINNESTKKYLKSLKMAIKTPMMNNLAEFLKVGI